MSTLANRLAGKRVIICAGAGGVGKTTVSATVALGLAAEGRRVAVVTIDPYVLWPLVFAASRSASW